MSLPKADQVVDLTLEDVDCNDAHANQTLSNNLGQLPYLSGSQPPQPLSSKQLQGLSSNGQHTKLQPALHDMLQSAQHRHAAHQSLQSLSAQLQQQGTHKTSQAFRVSQFSANPVSTLTDPALHFLDQNFMQDVLRVLIDSRPAPPSCSEFMSVFTSLSSEYMQLLNDAQIEHQGQTLVFLEWLTVKMFKHGLSLKHHELTEWVLLKCRAIQASLSIPATGQTRQIVHRSCCCASISLGTSHKH